MADEIKHVTVTDNVCLTKVNFRKSTYLWAIENYLSVHEKRKKVLRSSSFSADDDEFKWCLDFDPFEDDTWTSLYLKPLDNDFTKHSPIIGNLTFSILNADNVETCTQNLEFTLSDDEDGDTFAGFENFVSRSTLFNEESMLLPQDKLTIFCKVSYIKDTDIVHVSGKPFSNSLARREPACLEDIETLFLNSEFSDVTLIVQNETFPAHKNILVARSSVFKAMLTNDMKEKQSNRIELQDIKVPVFKEILRYMYSGKIQNLGELVSELLAAADKYDLKNLKMICEKELYEKLSPTTAVNTLMWADMYHAENLKEQTLLYIKMHSYTSNMLDKQFRKALVKSFPHLLLEIIDTFGKQSPM